MINSIDSSEIESEYPPDVEEGSSWQEEQEKLIYDAIANLNQIIDLLDAVNYREDDTVDLLKLGFSMGRCHELAIDAKRTLLEAAGDPELD